MRHIKLYEEHLNEKKPEGAPDWHDSDAPDAEGRFKELGIKDLAAWLIKTRDKDVRKITGSLNQQIVFSRKKDPEYADKMEKVRKEVYKQLGREDLLNEDAKIQLGGAEPLEIKEMEGGISLVQKSKIGSGKNVIVIPEEFVADLITKLQFYTAHGKVHENATQKSYWLILNDPNRWAMEQFGHDTSKLTAAEQKEFDHFLQLAKKNQG